MPRSRLSRDGREDSRLVKRCRQGDTGAFEDLVRKYQDGVYNMTFRMVGDREQARDLTQEAFLRAFEGIDTFNTRMSFRSWLYRIGTNAAIDHLRRKGRCRDVPVEITAAAGAGVPERNGYGIVIELPASEAEIPENVSVSNEIVSMVWEALEELPEKYRAVVVLHHIEGLSYAEIGRVLGVPRNTAKTWGHRARNMLCESLEGVI
jgi:RNA polymerase sigma-70 factor (ECF subfamily)